MNKRVVRVVLGVGYPWFWKTSLSRPGYQTVRIYAKGTEKEAKTLRIRNLGNDVRIRLVAEILPARRKKK